MPHINSIRCTKSQSKTKAHYNVFFLCKGLRYLNILFYMLNLWRIKCHVIPPLLSKEPFPWVFDMSQYFEKILPALESVLSSQQHQVYFNYGWWHCWKPVTSPNTYLPTPGVQKPGDVLKSLHNVRISFLTMSEYSLKITPRPSECSWHW